MKGDDRVQWLTVVGFHSKVRRKNLPFHSAAAKIVDRPDQQLVLGNVCDPCVELMSAVAVAEADWMCILACCFPPWTAACTSDCAARYFPRRSAAMRYSF
jgi:hypothetical protein